MLNKSEVMMLIKEAGLDAQFREKSKNHWSDGVKKISDALVVQMELSPVPAYKKEKNLTYVLNLMEKLNFRNPSHRFPVGQSGRNIPKSSNCKPAVNRQPGYRREDS